MPGKRRSGQNRGLRFQAPHAVRSFTRHWREHAKVLVYFLLVGVDGNEATKNDASESGYLRNRQL